MSLNVRTSRLSAAEWRLVSKIVVKNLREFANSRFEVDHRAVFFARYSLKQHFTWAGIT